MISEIGNYERKVGGKSSDRIMTTVYLHIGTMKTGTSALQRFLYENREYLQEQGYVYPDMRLDLPADYRFRNGHFLVYSFDRKVQVDEQKFLEDAFGQIGELAKKFDHIILSDEVIWHRSFKKTGFWQKLSEDFRKIDCEIKIILYLRRQDELVESLYNQAVKSSQMLNKDFYDYLNGKTVDYFGLHYYDRIEEIEKWIGRENITIRIYDKEILKENETFIFYDFLKAIGLTFDEHYKTEQAVRNPRLQGNYLELKRIVNSLPEYRKAGNFMLRPMCAANVAGEAGEKKQLLREENFFTPKERKAFLGRFEAGNRKLAEEYLGKENGKLFREPQDKQTMWQRGEDCLYRDIMLVTAATFCMQEERMKKLEQKLEDMKQEEEERKKAGRWFRRWNRKYSDQKNE